MAGEPWSPTDSSSPCWRAATQGPQARGTGGPWSCPSDALSLQVGYAPLKLPAAIGFVTAGAGVQTVGLRGYPDNPGSFDAVVVDGDSRAFSVSTNTLVLRASAGFELAVLPPGDPWGVHAGLIAGVAYAPLEPTYRLFGGAGLLDGAPVLEGSKPKLTPWSFSLSMLVGVGGGL